VIFLISGWCHRCRNSRSWIQGLEL